MESISYIFVQLLQIPDKRFFQTDMYRSHEIFIVACNERHLVGSKVLYLKIFQHSHHLHLCSAVNINCASHSIIPPMHHICECFVHYNFIFRTGHAAGLERHAHHRRIILTHIVTSTCGEERIARFIANHRSAVSTDRSIIGTGNSLYIRKPLKKLESGVTLFFLIPISIGKRQPLRVIPHILVQYILILRHHHTHKSADECHTRKLDEKQRTFPPLLTLGVTAEYLRYGNTGKQSPRQHPAHYKQYADYRQRNPNALRSKQ